MNEKFIHALISKNRPKSLETKKKRSDLEHKNKKVIIEDDPVQYLDGTVTIEEGL